MCGRINVSDNEGVRLLLEMLGMDVWPSRDPRYNVAPSSLLDVVVAGSLGTPSWAEMQWGLRAPWARAGKSSPPLINARAESLFEKPTFRQLARDHRIIIPITGFYEWHRKGKSKQPYLIRSADAPALLLAGIAQPANDDVNSQRACVVTTTANEKLSAVHNRMPVILNSKDALTWLTGSDEISVRSLMTPASNDAVLVQAVGAYVNNTRHQGAECQKLIYQ